MRPIKPRTAIIFMAACTVVAVLLGWYLLPHGLSIDKDSYAYRLGYGEIFSAKGRYARNIRHNPHTNPYLTMPRSEWKDYADDRAREGDNGDCDEFHIGTGDWHDYAAGRNQALQDIAAGRGPRIFVASGDPDCD